jgi:hypothetical protein
VRPPVGNRKEVVETPLGTEADLAQDPVLLHVHMLLQLDQRVLRRRDRSKPLSTYKSTAITHMFALIVLA